MGTTRQRKLVGTENGSKHASNDKIKRKKSSKSSSALSIRGQLICLLLSVGILIIFTGLYLDTVVHSTADKLARHLGYNDPVYAAIIDAGSTGSRLLAFSFHKAYLDGRLILDKELFIQLKPGLSSFVNEPKKGADSIKQLLEHAYKEIPKEYWKKTPLVLKATAGLRMLPEQKANALLDEVRLLFSQTPFHTNEDSVSIMDGVDEGIFSWVTVNFLQGLLNGNPNQAAAALDLGGGSTQVTFAATSDSSLSQKEYIYNVQHGNNNITLYTHSYLGLGLMAARKAILAEGNEKKSLNLISECINPIINNTKWHYNGKEYLVSGPKTDIRYKTDNANSEISVTEKHPVIKFEKCLSIVENYVKSSVVTPSELVSKKINAFSYYFDRATESGLIDPFTGGKVPVKDFLLAAKRTANSTNADQPFMTLDLTFIYVLLTDGFGLKPTTQLSLVKKINGHELSWALGAAIKILQN
ncbi:ectonucleoside triphosphate diphosphohydrolase 5 [Chrysoperla carnea]|uniref:ectonucleoside triphosphate diphosphohydrolase 5 n=1 Tax=Chrysoperla carnea TaxID=189513 RepID=UPI001D07AF5E|nr:ectonucleoside triphosphate diphosphohydrolase 5 [Chrysoperla carnea]